MSARNQKRKKHFISVIHGNKRENHRVLISERFFNLDDIKKWRLYAKLILQYINYLCEINNKDLNLFLEDIVKQVKNEAKQFERKMRRF